MSPSGLVGSVPLSTAFRPLAVTEPPADVLMRSQPGPSGWQLTVGAGVIGSALGPAFGPALTPARAPALAPADRPADDGMA
jgi:hypothetical protein